MQDFKHIIFDQQETIATIQLNRPDDANGIDSVMASELKRAALACESSHKLKVVILRAEGRFFSAGGDIKEMMSEGNAIGAAVKSLADDLHRTIASLCRMNAALIVEVNGVAAGAGFSLALIGDLVLAAESASFCMAYTKAGLSPDGSSSYFLPRLVGLRKAQELMLCNTLVSAEEALSIGMVTRVVADDELHAQASQMAAELAKSSRGSITSVKKLLMSTYDKSLEAQMDIEGRFVTECAMSPDGREGITAFVEKRAPEFA